MFKSYYIFLLVFLFINDELLCQECYDIIKSLSKKDACLSSRADLKKQMVKMAKDVDDYTSLMRNQTCNGLEYNSQSTISWINEIFFGISNDYTYNKNEISSSIDNQFTKYNGTELMNLFIENNVSNSAIIYNLRFSGNNDHNWIIYKLQEKKGWVIYQSYEEAYSLNAWLSKNISGYYNSTLADITLWKTIPKNLDDIIKDISKNNSNLNSTQNLSNTSYLFLIPYANYVRDYNQVMVMKNFMPAWNVYGKSAILDWDTFNNYLNILANLTNYFYANDNKDLNFSQKTWDDWITLFGTPNILYFPNVPTNFTTGKLYTPTRKFVFEIKKTFSSYFSDCKINDVYMNYLTTEASYLRLQFIFFLILIYNF